MVATERSEWSFWQYGDKMMNQEPTTIRKFRPQLKNGGRNPIPFILRTTNPDLGLEYPESTMHGTLPLYHVSPFYLYAYQRCPTDEEQTDGVLRDPCPC